MKTAHNYVREGLTLSEARRAMAEAARERDRAREVARLAPSLEALEEVRRCNYRLRRVALDYHGVPCPRCEGEGDVTGQRVPASWLSPAEWGYLTCTLCEGDGEVTAAEAFEWVHSLRDVYATDKVVDWLHDTGHPLATMWGDSPEGES